MSKEQKVLTKEELAEALKNSNLSWSDLAAIANTLKQQDNSERHKQIVATKTTYSVEISYPDLILTKTKGKNVSQIVLSITCDSYYMKTNNKVVVLNEDVWANFTSGMETIELKDYWIPLLSAGKMFYQKLKAILEVDGVLEAIKDKCYPTISDYYLTSKSHYYIRDCARQFKDVIDTYKIIKPIYKEIASGPDTKAKQYLTSRDFQGILYYIYQKYGLDKARDFVYHFNHCLIELGNIYNYAFCPTNQDTRYGSYREAIPSCAPFFGVDRLPDVVLNGQVKLTLPIMEMEYERLKEYLLYDSYRMGYGDIGHFLGCWTDALNCQMIAYKKIKEKYPAHIQTYHDIISRQASIVRNLARAEEFKTHAAFITNKYETQVGKYIFTVPKTPEEMLDEATQQSNCLAGYIDKFAEGKTDIIFMRKADEPEKSLVTIEVLNDHVTQAYLASNKIPGTDLQNVISQWAKHIKIVR